MFWEEQVAVIYSFSSDQVRYSRPRPTRPDNRHESIVDHVAVTTTHSVFVALIELLRYVVVRVLDPCVVRLSRCRRVRWSNCLIATTQCYILPPTSRSASSRPLQPQHELQTRLPLPGNLSCRPWSHTCCQRTPQSKVHLTSAQLSLLCHMYVISL